MQYIQYNTNQLAQIIDLNSRNDILHTINTMRNTLSNTIIQYTCAIQSRDTDILSAIHFSDLRDTNPISHNNHHQIKI